jgi:hypothetical protein
MVYFLVLRQWDYVQSQLIFSSSTERSGCHFNGIGFISTFINDYRYGLLVFDFEGSGAENQDADEVEGTLEKKLYDCGWDDRAAVIIIRPELESWVWSNSPHVVDELGWTGRKPSLQNWLKEKNFLEENNIKPKRPKEAMEAASEKLEKHAHLQSTENWQQKFLLIGAQMYLLSN